MSEAEVGVHPAPAETGSVPTTLRPSLRPPMAGVAPACSRAGAVLHLAHWVTPPETPHRRTRKPCAAPPRVPRAQPG